MAQLYRVSINGLVSTSSARLGCAQRKSNEAVKSCFVMTVDVDGWSSLLKFYSIDHDPDEIDRQVDVEKGILKLLQLFGTHEIKATFFVTGRMAQRYSWAIREIRRDGYEIACHGLTHEKNECLLNFANQKQRIREATRIIEEISGTRPKGFRAPCLRANETTLNVLESCRYAYDSSVLPTFIPGYYGFLRAPLRPYHPSVACMTNKGSCKILEIPLSINPIIPLPLSAAWMRNLGSSWVKFGIKMNFVLGNPVVFYIHPRDVVSLPRIKGVPWHLYKNVGDSVIKMLGDIFRYLKKSGATFIQAMDLAKCPAD